MRKIISASLPYMIIMAVFGYIIFHFLGSEKVALENVLTYLLPGMLAVSFMIIITLFTKEFRVFFSMFSNVKTKTWIFLALILLAGLAIRLATPQVHRLYFDEDIYENIGQNILTQQKAVLCNTGTPTSCEEWILNKQPNGYPFSLAFSFLLFGVSETVAFGLSIAVSVLSIALIFLLSYILLRNEKIALYAALVFALLPQNIIWATTVTSEPMLVFFILLSLISLFAYISSRKPLILLLSAALISFTIQIRHEAGIFIAVAVLVLALFDKKLLATMKEEKNLIVFIILLLLITPHIIHMLHASKYDNWGSNGEKLSLSYATKNVPDNTAFFFENTRHPLVFTVLALIGGIYCAFKNKKALAILLLIFAAFFGIYGIFYAGSVNYGVSVRYILTVYPVFAILAGAGAYALEKVFSSRMDHSYILALALILLSFLPFLGYTTSTWEEAFDARLSHEYALSSIGSFKGCYILSHVPSMYLVNGVDSLQTWNAKVNIPEMKKIFNQTSCVIFDDGYWCQIEPYKTDICTWVKQNYNLTYISSQYVRNNGNTFTFYKVQKPEGW